MTNLCSYNWGKGKVIVIGIAVLYKLSSAFYCFAIHVLVLEIRYYFFVTSVFRNLRLFI